MSFSPEELKKIKAAAKKLEEQKAAWGRDKLEVFEQLLKLPAFTEWAKDNIIVNRDVDHLNKQVLITVIYKGDYEHNMTSLQQLEKVKEAITNHQCSEDEDYPALFEKILEIINFDPARYVTKEDMKLEETEEGENN